MLHKAIQHGGDLLPRHGRVGGKARAAAVDDARVAGPCHRLGKPVARLHVAEGRAARRGGLARDAEQHRRHHGPVHAHVGLKAPVGALEDAVARHEVHRAGKPVGGFHVAEAHGLGVHDPHRRAGGDQRVGDAVFRIGQEHRRQGAVGPDDHHHLSGPGGQLDLHHALLGLFILGGACAAGGEHGRVGLAHGHVGNEDLAGLRVRQDQLAVRLGIELIVFAIVGHAHAVAVLGKGEALLRDEDQLIAVGAGAGSGAGLAGDRRAVAADPALLLHFHVGVRGQLGGEAHGGAEGQRGVDVRQNQVADGPVRQRHDQLVLRAGLQGRRSRLGLHHRGLRPVEDGAVFDMGRGDGDGRGVFNVVVHAADGRRLSAGGQLAVGDGDGAARVVGQHDADAQRIGRPGGGGDDAAGNEGLEARDRHAALRGLAGAGKQTAAGGDAQLAALADDGAALLLGVVGAGHHVGAVGQRQVIGAVKGDAGAVQGVQGGVGDEHALARHGDVAAGIDAAAQGVVAQRVAALGKDHRRVVHENGLEPVAAFRAEDVHADAAGGRAARGVQTQRAAVLFLHLQHAAVDHQADARRPGVAADGLQLAAVGERQRAVIGKHRADVGADAGVRRRAAVGVDLAVQVDGHVALGIDAVAVAVLGVAAVAVHRAVFLHQHAVCQMQAVAVAEVGVAAAAIHRADGVVFLIFFIRLSGAEAEHDHRAVNGNAGAVAEAHIAAEASQLAAVEDGDLGEVGADALAGARQVAADAEDPAVLLHRQLAAGGNAAAHTAVHVAAGGVDPAILPRGQGAGHHDAVAFAVGDLGFGTGHVTAAGEQIAVVNGDAARRAQARAVHGRGAAAGAVGVDRAVGEDIDIPGGDSGAGEHAAVFASQRAHDRQVSALHAGGGHHALGIHSDIADALNGDVSGCGNARRVHRGVQRNRQLAAVADHQIARFFLGVQAGRNAGGEERVLGLHEHVAAINAQVASIDVQADGHHARPAAVVALAFVHADGQRAGFLVGPVVGDGKAAVDHGDAEIALHARGVGSVAFQDEPVITL